MTHLKKTISRSQRLDEARSRIKSYVIDRAGVADPLVITFSKRLEKRIKWALEMQTPADQLPVDALYAFSTFDPSLIQDLIAWTKQPIPLSFFMDKFDKRQNPYRFDGVEKMGMPRSLKRVQTLVDRVLGYYRAGELVVDERGLSNYVGALCTYFPVEDPRKPSVLEMLVLVLNGTGASYSAEVFNTLSEFPTDMGIEIMRVWTQSVDFLRVKEPNNRIVSYLDNGFSAPFLAPVTVALSIRILSEYEKFPLTDDDLIDHLNARFDKKSIGTFFRDLLLRIVDDPRRVPLFCRFRQFVNHSELAKSLFNDPEFLKILDAVPGLVGDLITLSESIDGDQVHGALFWEC